MSHHFHARTERCVKIVRPPYCVCSLFFSLFLSQLLFCPLSQTASTWGEWEKHRQRKRETLFMRAQCTVNTEHTLTGWQLTESLQSVSLRIVHKGRRFDISVCGLFRARVPYVCGVRWGAAQNTWQRRVVTNILCACLTRVGSKNEPVVVWIQCNACNGDQMRNVYYDFVSGKLSSKVIRSTYLRRLRFSPNAIM